jgi:hypothetical protein
MIYIGAVTFSSVCDILLCTTVETDGVGWGYKGLYNGQLCTHVCNFSSGATVRALSVVWIVGASAPLPLSMFAAQRCKITSESFNELTFCPSTSYNLRFVELIKLSLSMP